MDYYSVQLLSTFGFWMCFFIIHGGVLLLLSLIILINKLWKRQTVIGAGKESIAAPPMDLVLSVDDTSFSSTNGQSYEVFLSFRGVNTRTNFTDHHYTALVDAGINTFRDDNEIRMGQELNSKLLMAIQQSRISIPVFSTNYASSKWCLIELTKMVECKENMDQIMLPIFYDVESSDVQYQRGTYGRAFKKHQKRFDKKIVEEWRKALQVAGSLKGHNVKNRHEAELIKLVVTMVLSKLKKTSLVSTGYLVGILHHIKEMLNLLDISSMEVRIVGIHGMGGIGKTTIAKAVYSEISCHFENCCFLEDVQESYQQHKGLVQLQKQLISNVLKLKDVDINSVDEGVNMIKERCCNKKVLIVLDDVDNLNQLRALANKRDWFGLGSRIIITTRDRHIMNKDATDGVYVPGELSPYQSLKLFSMHAFRRDRPLDEYYDLSSAIVHTAGGLPLALEVLGSHLSDKGKAMWKDALNKLTKIPHHEVQKKLRISYDELDHEQKQIFLDIACFFIGMNKRIATYICEEYFPHDGIDILLLRSLVKIGDNNELTMHSQLRDLGREIVRSENFDEPGERSRLWIHDDAWEVLKTHSGTRKVQGLRLDFRRELRNEEFAKMSELGNGSEENWLRNEEFVEMSRLRLLQIDYGIIAGDFKHLLSKLRWLSWKGCPYNFTATNFHPEKLIVLDLSRSKVTEDWDGWNQIKMAKNLKFINLSGCSDLIKTPDFSAFPSLEELILEDCRSLVEIHASIGYLKCLVFLNVKDCQSHVDLPISICGLNSLESLIVSGCIKLSRLPTGLESLKALRVLCVDGTSMEQLPDPIELPKKLEILSARNCLYFTVLHTSIGHLRFLTDLALDGTQIFMLPDSIGSLSKLRHLSLNDCKSLRKIPDSVGQLESLVFLNLEGAGVTEIPYSIGQLKFLTNLALDETQIVMLPDSIGSLSKLRHLSLSRCRSLRKIPDSIGHLKSLINFYLDETKIIELPDSIGLLVKLEKLYLRFCTSLRKIPDSIGQLESLVKLDLDHARVTEIPDSIGHLKSLITFCLDETQIIELPDSIGSLLMLQVLSLRRCRSLRRIPVSIGRLESLRWLRLSGIGIIEVPDAIGELKSLTDLQLNDTQISELPDSIGLLSMLQRLSLDGTQIIELPDSIGSLSLLDALSIKKCGSLRKIPDSIGRLESLRRLYLTESGIIEIPNAIGELKCLRDLQLDGTQIIELPDTIGSLSMLKELSLEKCRSLIRIPHTIGNLKSLTALQLDGTQITEVPDSIGSLSELGRLYLMHCRLLRKIPDSIWRLKSLYSLQLDTACIMGVPNAMRNHGNLKDLRIDISGIYGWDCCMVGGEIPIDIGKLPHSLRILTLGSENSFILPESISSLRLQLLDIRNCRNHPSLPQLPSTLSSLHISRCAMETLPNFSNITNLQHLTIADCENLLGIPSFQLLTLSISNCKKLQCFPHLPSGLVQLSLSRCMSVEGLPDLSSCMLVQSLQLIDFFKQTEIKGLERMKLLTSLDLSGCRSIERLPNMSIMIGLRTLILRNCEKLCDIEGLERLKYLYRLDVSGCISFSNCKQLIKIQGINKGVRFYGMTTRSRYVKIKSATGVEHLKNEKFAEDRGIKRLRLRSLETHRSIKRLR